METTLSGCKIVPVVGDTVEFFELEGVATAKVLSVTNTSAVIHYDDGALGRISVDEVIRICGQPITLDAVSNDVKLVIRDSCYDLAAKLRIVRKIMQRTTAVPDVVYDKLFGMTVCSCKS